MLVTTQLERIFSFKDKGQEIKLADPEPTWSVDAVLNFYSNTYPILTTSTVFGPTIKDDVIHYEFRTTIGSKG